MIEQLSPITQLYVEFLIIPMHSPATKKFYLKSLKYNRYYLQINAQESSLFASLWA